MGYETHESKVTYPQTDSEEIQRLYEKVARQGAEIERLRKIIKEASEVAGMGRRREACEMLHAEVYPDHE